jgi:spore coat polysaccharide biosynthesis predicted glycosyltransferase SpsG
VSPIGEQLDKFASKCDLVFTTASTTAVEFIAREKPIGVVCAVSNQEQFYESLIDLGIAAPIGKFENGVWKISREKIHELIMSKEYRESLRSNCVGFMDFKGASRIVDEIQLL